ncbi:glycosyltransferase [Novosphingobium sp. MW5]|nr:glycosyltransferase [Novosphingobium sp. MW5]
MGLRPIRSSGPAASGKIAVIMPAHNEAMTIGESLGSLIANCPPGVRCIVVADNCTDDTAQIARAHDCEVLVRDDPALRGKGFALAHAYDHLALDPPDVIIVIDADCAISKGGIAALASAVEASGMAAQSVNLQFDRSRSGGLVDVSNFALLVKNLVRTRGLQRLSGSSSLFGTGMALPWRYFRRETLATDNIVDDLALTVELGRAGVRCKLVEEAVVSSPSANWAETINQRRRWEHGFLITGMTKALPLLALGLRRGSRRLCGYGLHLLVPPLALLLMLASTMLVLAIVLAALGASLTPAVTLGSLLVFAGLAVFAAWVAEGRKTLPWQSLVQIPIYALRKVPIYAGLLLSRQTSWTRTRRDGEES